LNFIKASTVSSSTTTRSTTIKSTTTRSTTKAIKKEFGRICKASSFLIGFVLIGLSSLKIGAAELPNHDIVIFDLDNKGNELTISNPQIVAASPDYDNQPSFSVDGSEVYFTRIESGTANLWKWSLISDQEFPLAQSNLSEYSPTQIPFEPTSFSTVRVEQDGTQRLWKYSPQNGFSVIFESIKPVGYHAWSEKNIAMFVLGEPHTLQVSQLGKQSATIVDRNIGRCLQKVPGHNQISYTAFSGENSLLKVYDFTTQKISSLKLLPGNSQDYVWYSSDKVISSDGERLLVTDINQHSSWQSVQNLSKLKIKNISRLAISPNKDKLAVVFTKS